MPVKLFILGSPGSGKSTAYRTINDYILQSGRIKHVARINDYDNLREMFLSEERPGNLLPRRFKATEHDGFDVLDFATFDEPLRVANEKMKIWLATEPEWILIEFSRNDYSHAFRLFDPPLLRGAYVLFIEAQEELCRERIRERVRNPKTQDDHYVSEHILDSYYKVAGKLNILDLCKEYDIEADRVKVIYNNGSQPDFEAEVRRFVDTIL